MGAKKRPAVGDDGAINAGDLLGSPVAGHNSPTRRTAQNRRERRKIAAKLRALHAEAAGVLSLTVISPVDILQDIERQNHLHLVGRWWSTPTPCLMCRHQFAMGELPAAFVFVRAYDNRPDRRHWMTAALCLPCGQSSDRRERIGEAVRLIWPAARMVERPHAAPAGVQ